MLGMTRSAAVAALNNLLLLSEAVNSKTLKDEAKKFIEAAEAADKAEAKLAVAQATLDKEKETIAADRAKVDSGAKALERARERLAKDRGEFRDEVSETKKGHKAEGTRLANTAAALQERESRVAERERTAEATMEKAERKLTEANQIRATYEAREAALAKIMGKGAA